MWRIRRRSGFRHHPLVLTAAAIVRLVELVPFNYMLDPHQPHTSASGTLNLMWHDIPYMRIGIAVRIDVPGRVKYGFCLIRGR